MIPVQEVISENLTIRMKPSLTCNTHGKTPRRIMKRDFMRERKIPVRLWCANQEDGFTTRKPNLQTDENWSQVGWQTGELQ
jgi:hypothetical protein